MFFFDFSFLLLCFWLGHKAFLNQCVSTAFYLADQAERIPLCSGFMLMLAPPFLFSDEIRCVRAERLIIQPISTSSSSAGSPSTGHTANCTLIGCYHIFKYLNIFFSLFLSLFLCLFLLFSSPSPFPPLLSLSASLSLLFPPSHHPPQGLAAPMW